MDQHHDSLRHKLVELTDFEYTLILMTRTMRLDEIMCLIKLHMFLPMKLPNKPHHIMNIVNMHFQKSYPIHTIQTMLEFITTEPMFDEMFKDIPIEQMIRKYQKTFVTESVGVYELYLKPYTTNCIQCATPLNLLFSRRPKT
ncbi:unnamed protein product, partial [Adineta ricciae]